MSPSVVSGEGDGLLAAKQGDDDEGNLSCSEKICPPLCCKGLLAGGGLLVRIDVTGELAETGVVLRRGSLTFNGGRHAILSFNHNNYNNVK